MFCFNVFFHFIFSLLFVTSLCLLKTCVYKFCTLFLYLLLLRQLYCVGPLSATIAFCVSNIVGCQFARLFMCWRDLLRMRQKKDKKKSSSIGCHLSYDPTNEKKKSSCTNLLLCNFWTVVVWKWQVCSSAILDKKMKSLVGKVLLRSKCTTC